MFSVILVVVVTTAFGHPPTDKSVNQAIQEAAKTSKYLQLLQDNSTVMMELDMVMTKEDVKEYEALASGRVKRKAIRNKRWTNNVVTYSHIPFARNAILQAFDEYHKYTCIRFQQGNARNKIYFTDGDGCSSLVGMNGGSQPVTLAAGCRYKGVVIHELGHAVGLHHEQTRPDRDRFVTINFQNVFSDMAFNFRKNSVDDMGVPYSYLSVMHYDQTAFTRNGRPTIIAHQREYQNKMGNRQGFDFADIKILNIMYNCGGHCPKRNCPNGGFVGKDCECWCPGNPVTKCGGGGQITTGGGGGGGGGSGGGGGGGGGCFDSHHNKRDCRIWARQGYCRSQKYGYWTRNNCQRSCGTCGGRGKRALDECLDQFAKCTTWAENGECKSNPVYMSENCKKSCNTCSGFKSSGKCVDNHSACSSWAEEGLCEQTKRYMLETCPLSCDPKCKK